MVELIWTEKATKSLESIAEFIERDSLFYAKKTVKYIYELTKNLKMFPETGRYVEEYEDDKSIRQICIKHTG